jgi:acyl carrier protein
MDSLTIIREFLDSRLEIAPERVLPEAKLDDLDVDSLMLAEIVFEFEDRFNLTLPRNLKSPRTVGELVALMDRLRSEQG